MLVHENRLEHFPIKHIMNRLQILKVNGLNEWIMRQVHTLNRFRLY